VFTLDLEQIAQLPKKQFKLQAFSRFPGSSRDLALLADETIPSGRIVEVIEDSAGELLESVSLFDRYSGAQVPSGKVSLAFNLNYRAQDRTLSLAEVDDKQKAVLEALQTELNVVLR
jgi:phenylalanyl-tRNA synthetase beta chain